MLVAIINDAMAKKFWPGEDALGKRFKFFGDTQYRTIVGIAAPDFRSGVSGLAASVFLPLAKDGDVTVGGSRLEDRGKREVGELRSIEFKNVCFAYNEPEWVLKNVSFRVDQENGAFLARPW